MIFTFKMYFQLNEQSIFPTKKTSYQHEKKQKNKGNHSPEKRKARRKKKKFDRDGI